ncbi:MAG: ABC transporter transmembrane domain-containing protein, partial [Acidobacteriota bacterium]
MFRPRLLHWLDTAPRSLAGLQLVGFCVLMLEVALAWATARALGPLVGGASVEAVRGPLAATAVLTVAVAVATWCRGWLALRTAMRVKQRLRRRLCEHLLDLGPAFVVERSSGALRTLLVDVVEAIEGYLVHYLPRWTVAWVGSLGVLIGIATIDWQVAAVIAAAWLVLLLGPGLWERLLRDVSQAHWRAYGDYSGELLDALRGMATLVAFGASGRRGEALRRRGDDLYRSTRTLGRLAVARVGFSSLAVGVGTTLAVALAAIHAADAELPFADLVLVLFLAGVALRPVAELEQQWMHGYAAVTAEPHLVALLDERPAVTDDPDAVAIELVSPPSLRFESVGVTYRQAMEDGRDDAERVALTDVDFAVEPGTTLALVGGSGAGKSTLVGLLLRFADPTAGRVLLAGRDLRSLPLAQVRRAVAWVSQDVVLFPGTLAENLRFARPDASDGELLDVARRAAFDAVVAERHEGWSARLGAEGG